MCTWTLVWPKSPEENPAVIQKADQGSELRELGLSEDEERVYGALLRHRPADADERARLAGIPRPRLESALAGLAEQGLAAPGAPLPRPIAPAAAIRTLVHQRQAELHGRSAQLERIVASTDQIAGRLVEGSPMAYEGGMEMVTGAREIIGRVDSLLASAEHEVLILDRPPYAKAPEEYDDPSRSAGLDVESLLERGIVVRTVVDSGALNYPGRTLSLHRLAEQGAQVRTSSGVPTKMVMVDRRITLLPPTGRPTLPRQPSWCARRFCTTRWCRCSRRCGTARCRSATRTPNSPIRSASCWRCSRRA
ncbi:TrmB family transcriptional regulator [Streptomyces spinoverrucosus]|uniref:TrmB family transcriptional regulator n=1 Tax=Streptomyces spinoverrucosus TaxID=284043 RepID=UPI001E631D45|nr:helix-turn-helix domain-containing protein [Streptomyces spinoverrucosus]